MVDSNDTTGNDLSLRACLISSDTTRDSIRLLNVRERVVAAIRVVIGRSDETFLWIAFFSITYS